MHHSDNPDNFRNKKYLDECSENFKEMFRACHRYISYRDKLLKELSMNEEQRKELEILDIKLSNNFNRVYKILKKNGVIK